LPEIFMALGATPMNSYWTGFNPMPFCSWVISAMVICA
jgi:hypothetical protein